MAQFRVNAQRFDPYKNFKFRVKWDGRYVAGVSKVGALKRTTEVVKHREGGDPSTSRKSPGRTEYEAITLERGVTHDTEFEKWANKVWNFGAGLGAEVSLKDFRKDIIIEVYNEAGQLAIAYKVFRCWVSEFQASPISTRTPTPSPSRPSSWKTKAGSATTTWPNRASRPSPSPDKSMRLPTSAELIEAWERGAAQQWVDRGLALLAVAYPEKTFIQLQALTIAERDRLLLDLHRGLFGPSVACYAECPECQTQLEFAVNVENLLGGATYSAKSSAYEFVLKGLLVRFCAPDSEDLAALRACADVASASRTLLERCVLEATRGNQPVAVTELPADVVEEISSTLAQSESHADISMVLECVSCAHRWELAFDIVSFLWAEISARAKRFLGEVHTLAWAYGWREADILAMSPARRQFYLDRVENG